MTEPVTAGESPIGHRLAGWAIAHPVGVVMLMLAAVVLGLFTLNRLGVDLLPHIIYPEIRVRILDPGVPAEIMEDRVTRQLEEQLAITEDAISVQSRSSEGRSSVDLSFAYGKDIDVALRDASTRLDRAKRFLPETIQPPIIFKRDPSQLPALELVVSSASRDPVKLRTWVDDLFAKWFLNLPGVAAVEVGGGLVREIHILPDQGRLAGMGLTLDDLTEAIGEANRDTPAGRVTIDGREMVARTAGRFRTLDELMELPVPLGEGRSVPLGELATIIDTHQEERLRVRLNGIPGVKVSMQKQPAANTVEVVELIRRRMAELKRQRLIPEDIQVHFVSDQALYIRAAIHNATTAALSGALLAMLVVYLFLGDLRRTLVIGSAIPIAVMVTFVLMGISDLTLNIMSLGGLAVGIGMLVDSTIVMLENIVRHQQMGENPREAGTHAAGEVYSPIVAATSTNLAAVIPFVFIGGLVGLLFRELIIPISAAIVASMVVSLTLVPSLAARIPAEGRGEGLLRRGLDRLMALLQTVLSRLVGGLLRRPAAQLLLLALLTAGLTWAWPHFNPERQEFLPRIDDGRVSIRITTDTGSTLEETDALVRRLEALIERQPWVESIFVSSGGFIFGRSTFEASNRATIVVQLVPADRRPISNQQWMRQLRKAIRRIDAAGARIRVYVRGIRGIPLGRGNDEVSLRVRGPDLDTLVELGHRVARRIEGIPGVTNVVHSFEARNRELAIRIDRERAASFDLTPEEIGRMVRLALEGEVVSDFIEGDRAYDIRLRLPLPDRTDLGAIESLLISTADDPRGAIFLSDVARVELIAAPAVIQRDNQQRIIEITASLQPDRPRGEILHDIQQAVSDLELPDGYGLYDAGIGQQLQESRQTSQIVLALALFLVFTVMAIQYESLRNPLVILLGIPFAAIGVAAGLEWTGTPISMPVWLGLIMLAGIVVNNAIVLVEYVELERMRGSDLDAAILVAIRLRLRPILMTTLTTVAGLLPLAMAWGEGAGLLQPLAITIISGLSFSLLVSLLLIPLLYRLAHRATSRPSPP
ncbi:MAG TPA: efflux RND transporter permease subunit [Thiotrichales bacterium]|nr:efflux RND transporter permease subunit [Thiotrichales bacterium]